MEENNEHYTYILRCTLLSACVQISGWITITNISSIVYYNRSEISHQIAPSVEYW